MTMHMINDALIKKLISDFPLHLKSIHGPEHWGRVLEYGYELAKETGADEEVVMYFAVFHDCARGKDGRDFRHGERGAMIAETLRGNLYELSEDKFIKLIYACTHHTDGLIDSDPTIGTCWDADRLDLPRVGIIPSLKKLSTQAAKNPGKIEECGRKSKSYYVPEFVLKEWM